MPPLAGWPSWLLTCEGTKSQQCFCLGSRRWAWRGDVHKLGLREAGRAQRPLALETAMAAGIHRNCPLPSATSPPQLGRGAVCPSPRELRPRRSTGDPRKCDVLGLEPGFSPGCHACQRQPRTTGDARTGLTAWWPEPLVCLGSVLLRSEGPGAGGLRSEQANKQVVSLPTASTSGPRNAKHKVFLTLLQWPFACLKKKKTAWNGPMTGLLSRRPAWGGRLRPPITQSPSVWMPHSGGHTVWGLAL